jgi:hypothetical protein
MNARRWVVGVSALAPVVAITLVLSAQTITPVPFPEDYRSWQHVRTIVVGKDHTSYARRGGIHHYYANKEALEGFRTGTFPNGSIVVDEGVFAKDGEDQMKGILLENGRRSLDVMTKNATIYADTGGWGFEHFDGDDKTGKLDATRRAQCHDCHAKRKDRDYVFSSIRP